jgi:hypothetical protein
MVGAFLSGLVLGAFALAVVLVVTINAKTSERVRWHRGRGNA